MNDKEIKELYDKLHILNKLYDIIRLIDPENKRVIGYSGCEYMESTLKCFDVLGRDKKCENCVSMRAYHENQTFIKLEYFGHDVFMITAVPIELSDRRAVIELFKNVKDSLILQNSSEHDNVVSGMIENINLMASKDSLTGIYNRKYIYEKLPADIVNATVSGHRIGLIMADIDHFKQVNDTYGHLAGDEVLRVFARVLIEELRRESDWVARYGGEEFLVCIPGASKEITFEIAERMRQAFENTTIHFNGTDIRATASFGISHLIPDKDVTIEKFIGYADKNLYLAKNKGRNRVEG
jgi:diguanylate cyclase (GGDEF)-like protein